MGNVVKRDPVGAIVVENDKGIFIKADEWNTKVLEAIEKCPKKEIKDWVFS